VALDYHARLKPGETVLILGSSGSAGQFAVQSARILGAGLVVGAARGGAPRQAADQGVHATVDLTDNDAIDVGLASAAPGGYDVIIDFLWGAPAPHAINHANVGARYIQVGSSAGPASSITASALRSKLLTLVGQGMVGTPAEVRRSAYAQLMRHALDGQLTLDLEQTRLHDISETWGLLKAGPRYKLVVKPLRAGPWSRRITRIQRCPLTWLRASLAP
jgi:NADPH2:quinone reductase